MTATAIGDTEPQATPVGRPGKAMLAGAAVAGALLVSVPFLLLGGNKDDGRSTSAEAPGTVLAGDEQRTPGDFVAATPEAGAPEDAKVPEPKTPDAGAPAAHKDDEDGKAPKGDADGKKDEAGGGKAPSEAKVTEEKPKTKPKTVSSGQNSSSNSGADKKASTKSAVSLGSPVSIRNHMAGLCLNVPHSQFNDGMRLDAWNCNGTNAQKWQTAADGTLRIGGLCLDVANAVFREGTPIQLAYCSGNIAQKFVINERNDLVNTVVGMCVDVPADNRGNGAKLQLWTCTGKDNQKWSYA